MKAIDWLNSEKDYDTGIKVLEEAKSSSFILNLLKKGKSFYNCRLLEKEIKAISEKHKPKAKVKAPAPKVVQTDLTTSEIPPQLATIKTELQKQYAIVNHLHPLMDAYYNTDRKKSFETKIAIQKAWKEIEELWRIINYYKANGVLLPSKYSKDAAPMEEKTKVELVKRRNNVRTYISKHRNNPKKIRQVADWEKELEDIELKIGTTDYI
tara:strand:+ start:3837 stop:4466 length:630 start_codon:yes stop_codon:yes gene_type:complete